MKIVEDGSDVLSSVTFKDIKVFDKFSTVANNKIVVWRKLCDKINYLHGEDPNCDYTCPQPNAITETGFPATFNPNCKVFRTASSEYNDIVKMTLLKIS